MFGSKSVANQKQNNLVSPSQKMNPLAQCEALKLSLETFKEKWSPKVELESGLKNESESVKSVAKTFLHAHIQKRKKTKEEISAEEIKDQQETDRKKDIKKCLNAIGETPENNTEFYNPVVDEYEPYLVQINKIINSIKNNEAEFQNFSNYIARIERFSAFLNQTVGNYRPKSIFEATAYATQMDFNILPKKRPVSAVSTSYPPRQDAQKTSASPSLSPQSRLVSIKPDIPYNSFYLMPEIQFKNKLIVADNSILIDSSQPGYLVSNTNIPTNIGVQGMAQMWVDIKNSLGRLNPFAESNSLPPKELNEYQNICNFLYESMILRGETDLPRNPPHSIEEHRKYISYLNKHKNLSSQLNVQDMSALAVGKAFHVYFWAEEINTDGAIFIKRLNFVETPESKSTNRLDLLLDENNIPSQVIKFYYPNNVADFNLEQKYQESLRALNENMRKNKGEIFHVNVFSQILEELDSKSDSDTEENDVKFRAELEKLEKEDEAENKQIFDTTLSKLEKSLEEVQEKFRRLAKKRLVIDLQTVTIKKLGNSQNVAVNELKNSVTTLSERFSEIQKKITTLEFKNNDEDNSGLESLKTEINRIQMDISKAISSSDLEVESLNNQIFQQEQNWMLKLDNLKDQAKQVKAQNDEKTKQINYLNSLLADFQSKIEGKKDENIDALQGKLTQMLITLDNQKPVLNEITESSIEQDNIQDFILDFKEKEDKINKMIYELEIICDQEKINAIKTGFESVEKKYITWTQEIKENLVSLCYRWNNVFGSIQNIDNKIESIRAIKLGTLVDFDQDITQFFIDLYQTQTIQEEIKKIQSESIKHPNALERLPIFINNFVLFVESRGQEVSSSEENTLFFGINNQETPIIENITYQNNRFAEDDKEKVNNLLADMWLDYACARVKVNIINKSLKFSLDPEDKDIQKEILNEAGDSEDLNNFPVRELFFERYDVLDLASIKALINKVEQQEKERKEQQKKEIIQSTTKNFISQILDSINKNRFVKKCNEGIDKLEQKLQELEQQKLEVQATQEKLAELKGIIFENTLQRQDPAFKTLLKSINQEIEKFEKQTSAKKNKEILTQINNLEEGINQKIKEYQQTAEKNHRKIQELEEACRKDIEKNQEIEKEIKVVYNQITQKIQRIKVIIESLKTTYSNKVDLALTQKNTELLSNILENSRAISNLLNDVNSNDNQLSMKPIKEKTSSLEKNKRELHNNLQNIETIETSIIRLENQLREKKIQQDLDEKAEKVKLDYQKIIGEIFTLDKKEIPQNIVNKWSEIVNKYKAYSSHSNQAILVDKEELTKQQEEFAKILSELTTYKTKQKKVEIGERIAQLTTNNEDKKGKSEALNLEISSFQREGNEIPQEQINSWNETFANITKAYEDNNQKFEKFLTFLGNETQEINLKSLGDIEYSLTTIQSTLLLSDLEKIERKFREKKSEREAIKEKQQEEKRKQEEKESLINQLKAIKESLENKIRQLDINNQFLSHLKKDKSKHAHTLIMQIINSNSDAILEKIQNIQAEQKEIDSLCRLITLKLEKITRKLLDIEDASDLLVDNNLELAEKEEQTLQAIISNFEQFQKDVKEKQSSVLLLIDKNIASLKTFLEASETQSKDIKNTIQEELNKQEALKNRLRKEEIFSILITEKEANDSYCSFIKKIQNEYESEKNEKLGNLQEKIETIDFSIKNIEQEYQNSPIKVEEEKNEFENIKSVQSSFFSTEEKEDVKNNNEEEPESVVESINIQAKQLKQANVEHEQEAILDINDETEENKKVFAEMGQGIVTKFQNMEEKRQKIRLEKENIQKLLDDMTVDNSEYKIILSDEMDGFFSKKKVDFIKNTKTELDRIFSETIELLLRENKIEECNQCLSTAKQKFEELKNALETIHESMLDDEDFPNFDEDEVIGNLHSEKLKELKEEDDDVDDDVDVDVDGYYYSLSKFLPEKMEDDELLKMLEEIPNQEQIDIKDATKKIEEVLSADLNRKVSQTEIIKRNGSQLIEKNDYNIPDVNIYAEVEELYEKNVKIQGKLEKFLEKINLSNNKDQLAQEKEKIEQYLIFVKNLKNIADNFFELIKQHIFNSQEDMLLPQYDQKNILESFEKLWKIDVIIDFQDTILAMPDTEKKMAESLQFIDQLIQEKNKINIEIRDFSGTELQNQTIQYLVKRLNTIDTSLSESKLQHKNITDNLAQTHAKSLKRMQELDNDSVKEIKLFYSQVNLDSIQVNLNLNAFNALCTNVDQEIKQIKNSFDEVKNSINYQTQQANTVQNYENTLMSGEEKQQLLEKELAKEMEIAREFNERNSMLEEDNKELFKRGFERFQEIEALSEKIAQFEENHRTEQRKNNEAISTLKNELQTQVEEIERLQKESHNEKEQLNQALAEETQKIRDLNSEQTTLRSSMMQLQQSLTSKEEEKQELESALETSQNKLKQLKEEKDRRENQTSEIVLMSAEENQKRRIEQIERVKELEVQQKNLTNEITQKETEKEDLVLELAQLKEAHDEKEKLITAGNVVSVNLHNRLKELSTENITLKKELIEKEELVAEKENEFLIFRGENAHNIRKLEAKETQLNEKFIALIKKLEEQKDKEDQLLKAHQTSVDGLKQELEALQLAHHIEKERMENKKQEESHQKTQEIQALSEKIVQLEEESEEEQETQQLLFQENVKLNRQLEDGRNRIQELEKGLSELLEENTVHSDEEVEFENYNQIFKSKETEFEEHNKYFGNPAISNKRKGAETQETELSNLQERNINLESNNNERQSIVRVAKMPLTENPLQAEIDRLKKENADLQKRTINAEESLKIIPIHQVRLAGALKQLQGQHGTSNSLAENTAVQEILTTERNQHVQQMQALREQLALAQQAQQLAEQVARQAEVARATEQAQKEQAERDATEANRLRIQAEQERDRMQAERDRAIAEQTRLARELLQAQQEARNANNVATAAQANVAQLRTENTNLVVENNRLQQLVDFFHNIVGINSRQVVAVNPNATEPLPDNSENILRKLANLSLEGNFTKRTFLRVLDKKYLGSVGKTLLQETGMEKKLGPKKYDEYRMDRLKAISKKLSASSPSKNALGDSLDSMCREVANLFVTLEETQKLLIETAELLEKSGRILNHPACPENLKNQYATKYREENEKYVLADKTWNYRFGKLPKETDRFNRKNLDREVWKAILLEEVKELALEPKNLAEWTNRVNLQAVLLKEFGIAIRFDANREQLYEMDKEAFLKQDQKSLKAIYEKVIEDNRDKTTEAKTAEVYTIFPVNDKKIQVKPINLPNETNKVIAFMASINDEVHIAHYQNNGVLSDARAEQAIKQAKAMAAFKSVSKLLKEYIQSTKGGWPDSERRVKIYPKDADDLQNKAGALLCLGVPYEAIIVAENTVAINKYNYIDRPTFDNKIDNKTTGNQKMINGNSKTIKTFVSHLTNNTMDDPNKIDLIIQQRETLNTLIYDLCNPIKGGIAAISDIGFSAEDAIKFPTP